MILALLLLQTPNVVAVVIDDVGWIDVELVATPSMDWLSSQGTTYTRFYVSPVCTPSRTQFLYGLPSSVTGMGAPFQLSLAFEICADLVSLPRELRGIGYRTALFGKNHTIAVDPGRVLEEWDEAHAWTQENIRTPKPRSYYLWDRLDGLSPSVESTYATTAVTDAALAWLSSPERMKGPWFACVSYHAIHAPWQDAPGQVPGETHRERLEGMLAFLDIEIGRLLGAIDLESTLVYLFSDNGTPPEATPSPVPGKGKYTVREPGIRVPLVIAGWNEPKGVSNDLVCITQLRGDILSRASGNGKRLGGSSCLVQYFRPNGLGPRSFDRRAAVLSSPWVKLTYENGIEHLYVLPSDEEVPMKDYPDLVNRLRAILEVGDVPMLSPLQAQSQAYAREVPQPEDHR